MFGNREQMRQMYCQVFEKMQQGSVTDALEMQIAKVISEHPEYHALFQSGAAVEADYSVESGETNPFLHMGMHLGIREQVGTDRPLGIRTLFEQLAKQCGPSEAEHQMMECLGQSLWEAQRQNTTPDESSYLNCIRRLKKK